LCVTVTESTVGSQTQKSGHSFEFGLSLQTKGTAPQTIASKAG